MCVCVCVCVKLSDVSVAMTPVLVKNHASSLKLPDICQFCCQHLFVAMFCVSVKLSDVKVAMTPVLLGYHA